VYANTSSEETAASAIVPPTTVANTAIAMVCHHRRYTRIGAKLNAMANAKTGATTANRITMYGVRVPAGAEKSNPTEAHHKIKIEIIAMR
jgi:hypothetical protein